MNTMPDSQTVNVPMKEHPGMTVADAFAHAIEAEHGAQAVYLEFAKMFAHAAEVGRFWADLAHDESRHAEELRKVRQSLTAEQLAAPAGDRLAQDLHKAGQLLGRDVLHSVRTLDDAYEVAHELEFSEVNRIFRTLAGEFVPSKRRLEFVAAEIAQHLEKLLDFGRESGDAVARRAVLAQRPSPASVN